MLPFQWNSLRVGDRVAVHDDADPALELGYGVVCVVQTRWRAVNEVGVRLDEPGAAIMRPRRHAVHLLPLDRRDCWRCESGDARSPGSGRAVAA